MRGNIEPRGRGYRITVRLGKDEDTGKYIRVREQFNGTHKQAEQRLTQILSDWDKGVFVIPNKLTLGQYLRTWLKDTVKPSRSAKTHESYNDICTRHIIPVIGTVQLTKLRKGHVQHLYSEMTEKGLTRSVTLSHAILHKAIEDAIPDYLIRNVVKEAGCPKFTEKEFIPLTAAEIHILLEFAKDTPYYELFYTYIFTGCRRSELLALQWSDLNLEGDPATIQINRSMEYLDAGEKGHKISYKAPKTEKSRRLIPLTISNATILKEYKGKLNGIRAKLKLPALEPSALVFCHPHGEPYTPNGITHAWIRLRKKCGIKGVRLHDTRHTFATILFNQDVPVKVVQELLGHSRISTTYDTYTHVIPGMSNEAVKKLENALIPKQQA